MSVVVSKSYKCTARDHHLQNICGFSMMLSCHSPLPCALLPCSSGEPPPWLSQSQQHQPDTGGGSTAQHGLAQVSTSKCCIHIMTYIKCAHARPVNVCPGLTSPSPPWGGSGFWGHASWLVPNPLSHAVPCRWEASPPFHSG
jgi:hypothetical protein